MATMCVPTLGSQEGVTGRLCNAIITLMATNKNNPKQNASTSKRMRQEDTDDDVDIPKNDLVAKLFSYDRIRYNETID